MIQVSRTIAVHRLLHRVASAPALFNRVLLCSPFFDRTMSALLVSLAVSTRRAQCGFRVITRPQAVDELRECFPGHASRWSGTFVPVDGLHAKVYLAIGRRPVDTRAIVTSANLTTAGLWENLEIGVLAAPTSDAGNKIVSEVRDFLERLVDSPRRSLTANDPRRAA